MDSQKLLDHKASAPHGENQAPCIHMLGMQLHRGLSIGAKNVPDRVRFTRVLLQSKDWSMWFCLPLCVWVPGLGPSSVETSHEKRSPRSTFLPGWEAELQEAGKASLLRARRGSQTACVWKPQFGNNGLILPKGDL